MKTLLAITLFLFSLTSYSQNIKEPNVIDYFTNKNGYYGITDKGDTIKIEFGSNGKSLPNSKKTLFGNKLSSGGSYIAAGGAFILIGTVSGVLSIVLDEPTFSYIGVSSGVIGAICLITGGAKISKAGKEFNQINFGTAKRKQLQYDYYGTYASIKLKF
jgi:hypothetical protein